MELTFCVNRSEPKALRSPTSRDPKEAARTEFGTALGGDAPVSSGAARPGGCNPQAGSRRHPQVQEAPPGKLQPERDSHSESHHAQHHTPPGGAPHTHYQCGCFWGRPGPGGPLGEVGCRGSLWGAEGKEHSNSGLFARRCSPRQAVADGVLFPEQEAWGVDSGGNGWAGLGGWEAPGAAPGGRDGPQEATLEPPLPPALGPPLPPSRFPVRCHARLGEQSPSLLISAGTPPSGTPPPSQMRPGSVQITWPGAGLTQQIRDPEHRAAGCGGGWAAGWTGGWARGQLEAA